MYLLLELRSKSLDQSLVELDLAERAALLASAPRQDALAVEEVAQVARQTDDRLAWLESFDAERTFNLRCESLTVESCFVELQNAHLLTLIDRFLPFPSLKHLAIESLFRLALRLKSCDSLLFNLLLFLLLLFGLCLLELLHCCSLLLGKFAQLCSFFFALFTALGLI